MKYIPFCNIFNAFILLVKRCILQERCGYYF